MFDSVSEFLEEPYGENMNALDWFLFIGFVVAMLFAWSRIINLIGD